MERGRRLPGCITRSPRANSLPLVDRVQPLLGQARQCNQFLAAGWSLSVYGNIALARNPGEFDADAHDNLVIGRSRP